MCIFLQKLQSRENIRKVAPSIKYMNNYRPIICIYGSKIVNNYLSLKVSFLCLRRSIPCSQFATQKKETDDNNKVIYSSSS